MGPHSAKLMLAAIALLSATVSSTAAAPIALPAPYHACERGKARLWSRAAFAGALPGLDRGHLARRVWPSLRAPRCLAQSKPRRRTHLLTSSGNADDVALSDEGFQDYMRKAPQRLLSHLRQGTLDDEGRTLTKKFIIELEQQQNFPYDVDFFNWAVGGTWDLLYSSSRLSVPDPNLRVRDIQAVYDGETQTFRHVVSWEFEESISTEQQVLGGTEEEPTLFVEEEEEGLVEEEGEVGGQAKAVETAAPKPVTGEVFRTKGTFETVCKYNMSEVPSVPTRMLIELDEMRITPDPVDRPPKNPQALVAAIQRAVPREYFDPNEALMDTTYLDPNLRIVCYLGMRFAGVRHVYARRGKGMG